MKNLTLNSGFYYGYDMNGQALNTKVTNGAYAGTLAGAKIGRNLLTFNLGAEYQVAQNFSVFGGYQGEHAIDRANSQVHSTGHIGVGWKW
jgi:uncharacterized protein with beta-barrel porin domain